MESSLVNPLTGIETLPELLEAILNGVLTIAIPVIILMIIYTGFKFVQAQGNPQAINKAKEQLMWTLIGAGILLGAKGIQLVVTTTIEAFTS